MMEQPALLLLDEPMAGVHPNLRSELVTTLKRINGQGITLVIIEHDMHFISETCTLRPGDLIGKRGVERQEREHDNDENCVDWAAARARREDETSGVEHA